ncbi:MAG: sigma 54-interacting transcriptional regulator [Deltaproteobacteria bacterium]|nr:sigma 54-interacting transcriptional regulator [Deltaproteobacteria bacterium]
MTKRSKSRSDRSQISTVRNLRAVKSDPSGRFELLIIINNTVSSFPLPPSGQITIGRSRNADVQIVDPSVSREHARLSIDDSFSIADLGSANGTAIKGKPIALDKEVELMLGEVVEIGSALLMVQRRPISTREWRIWAHGYFQDRLENECARVSRNANSFGLLRVRCGKEASVDAVQQVLASALRNDDVVGLYGPGEYEVLAIERNAEEVRALADSLLQALQEAGVLAKTGVARFPTDGTTAHTLEAVAGAQTRDYDELTEEGEGRVIVLSAAMKKIYDFVSRIAASDIAILVLGETGVGKEVVAEAIHNRSPRRDKPFLRLNCAALSESLLESELFGHEKGSFTGAVQTKRGLLETANGGTVFLDEIGDLPAQVQVKLLRVLEERQVWRVGSVTPRKIDVRFISATHRDLERSIVAGNFRQDLYFRLNGVSLHIPPLRKRKEEIEPLAREFVRRSQRGRGRGGRLPVLSKEVISLLLQYPWPGNIRELQNAIERAVLLGENGQIMPEHLPIEKMTATLSTPIDGSYNKEDSNPPQPLKAQTSETVNPPPGKAPVDMSLADMLKQQVQTMERQHIIEALNRCGGNQTRAAKQLGISRRTLISRLEAYSLPRPLKDQRSD